MEASLDQNHGIKWKTVAFASSLLNVRKIIYNKNELELLDYVGHLTILRILYYWFNQFLILTDHNILKMALRNNKDTKKAQSHSPVGIINFH